MSIATGTISKEEFARVREQVRRLVANPAGADDATLSRIAREYAAAADLLNGRLVRCADWIARGLRTEAVHEASLPPDLSESLRALDLGAELREFEDLCAFHDIQLQYDLNWDLAAQLDEAIATERELEKQSRSYRRACIGRRPLAERRRRLKRLVDLDPLNDVWTESLVSLDQARLQQINRESKFAVSAQDLARLDELLVELVQSDWQLEVPERLVQELKRARDRIAADAARGSLVDLAEELAERAEHPDDDALLAATHRWYQAVSLAGGAVADELAALVAPALDRANQIHREQQAAARHAQDCALLEDAIDRGASPKQLQAIARSIRGGRPLPADLEARLATAIADTRRRHMLFVGGVLAMVLVAIALVTAAIVARTIGSGDTTPPAAETVVPAAGGPDAPDVRRDGGR